MSYIRFDPGQIESIQVEPGLGANSRIYQWNIVLQMRSSDVITLTVRVERGNQYGDRVGGPLAQAAERRARYMADDIVEMRRSMAGQLVTPPATVTL